MTPSKEVLLQILNEASNQNISLGKTQLVKFLYLTEVEYYRILRERLTDLRWLFYHYGPYALELEDILAQKEFESKQFTTRAEKEFVRFRVAEQIRGYKTSLNPKITLMIKRIVGQWKDKSLPELLDYVYFETEPMQEVKNRGDLLDFSTIGQESSRDKVIPIKASKAAEEKVAELRARLRPFLVSVAETRFPELKLDSECSEALKTWDEDEQPDLTVPFGLVITITKPSTESAKKGS